MYSQAKCHTTFTTMENCGNFCKCSTIKTKTLNTKSANFWFLKSNQQSSYTKFIEAKSKESIRPCFWSSINSINRPQWKARHVCPFKGSELKINVLPSSISTQCLLITQPLQSIWFYKDQYFQMNNLKIVTGTYCFPIQQTMIANLLKRSWYTIPIYL